MSDSPEHAGWAPPGDAAGDTAAGGPPREDTVSFSTEATQRIPRDEPPPPPPPPPPPAATGGWPPPPPSAGRAYGPGAWQPPPRPRRRTGLVVGIAIAVVGLVLLVGAGAVVAFRSVDVAGGVDVDLGGPDQAVPALPDDVPADDLQAQAGALLRTINTSEERMIAFQQVVFGSIEEDGTVGDAAAEIAQEAQDAGDDLTGLRSDLRALAGGEAQGFDGLRDVRDTYAAHMDAWIEYLDAVAGSPALAAPESSDAEPFWRDIETTGDDFVHAVDSGLPADLPADLQDLARFIIERGFGGGGGGPTSDVV